MDFKTIFNYKNIINYFKKDIKINNIEIVKLDNVLFTKYSTPITCNSKLLNWIVDCQVKAYETNKKNLSRNMVDELTNLYGKHNKSLRLEFVTKLWILKYDNLIFNVFTAKNKGTSIEVCDVSFEDINSGKLNTKIIGFLDELYKQINK